MRMSLAASSNNSCFLLSSGKKVCRRDVRTPIIHRDYIATYPALELALIQWSTHTSHIRTKMDAVLAAVAAAALNHHRNPPMARDLDPAGRHVARRLRACSAAYMALGASLLVAAGDHDRILVGFLLWMAGTALLLLSSVATRLPAVAAGVAQDVLEELCASAPATVIALAHKLMRRHPL